MSDDGLSFKYRLLIPAVPNFILLDDPRPYSRTDGPPESSKIPISQLSQEQLEAIGREWTKKLIEASKRK